MVTDFLKLDEKCTCCNGSGELKKNIVCVECKGIGTRLTADGEYLIKFLRKYL